MGLWKVVLPVLALFPGLALAGPNAGGVLLVHANTSLVYTSDTTSCCGQSGLAACSLAVTSVPWDPETTTVFYVIAAFPDTAQSRLKAITWGVEWDASKLVILAHGSCADFDVPDGGWPASGKGIGQSFTETRTGLLTELYWFAAYAYGGVPDTATFALVPHPVRGGQMADDAAPPLEDAVAEYGRLGLGAPGWLPCLSTGDQAGSGQGLDGSGDAPLELEGDEGGGGGGGLSLNSRWVLSPSTHQNPFEKIDIYADRTAQFRNQDHQPANGYPSWLTDPNALIVRHRETPPGDTLAAAHSYANDFTFIDSRATEQGYLEYAVDPPRFASSVDLLATGYYLFNDQNTYNDYGHPILKVTTTHEGGGSYVDTLKVGIDMRNYRNGTVASCNYAILESRLPEDPLSGEVWSGEWGTPPATWYYDVHELLIPTALQNKRITSIRLDALYEWAHCYGSVYLYGGSRINGISVDSRFHAHRPDGTQVVTQSQGTSTPYGGYVHNGNVIGTFGTMGSWGCFLVCCSMLHNYYGVPCTPEELNQYLQEHRGFGRELAANVLSIRGQSQGDSVRVRVLWDTDLRQGWRILVEHGAYGNPVATLELLQDVPKHTEGWTRIAALHGSSDQLDVDDKAFVFRSVDGERAARFPDGTRKFALERYTGSDSVECIATLEQALVDSVPCLLHTRIDSKGAHHWVLADGMRPHFFPATGDHHGTYMVHDPASATRDELLDAPSNNKLTERRVARAVGGMQWLVGDAAFVLNLTGTAVLGITDPLGRTIDYDAENDRYVSGIPASDADRGSAIWDPADSTAEAGGSDEVAVRDAIDGDYRIEVIGEEAGDFGMSLLGFDTEGGVTGWAGSGATAPGSARVFIATYSAEPGVGIEVQEDPAWIGDPNGDRSLREFRWEVPNPYRAGQPIALEVARAGLAEVAIYDVQGRKIRALLADQVAAGRLELRWDGRLEAGPRAAAGVYYVEARIGAWRGQRKVVLVR